MPPPRPKVPPYLLMLVVSFALVGLIGYQTLKDRKISSDLLLENQILKDLLKKEKKKANDLQDKFTKLSSQKEELNGVREGLSGQLIELKRVKSLTDEGKRKLESSLLEKENEVKDLKEKIVLFDEKEEELKLMKKEISQKDSEISELKAQIKAVGKHFNGKFDGESTNTSAVKEEEEKHDKQVVREEQSTLFGQGIAEKEKQPPEVDEETEDAKPEATTDEHPKEREEMPKKESHVQVADLEDEESKVDDREENLTNEDGGEEVDADKTRDEDETDEQPDVDMDVVNKADLDENEMAAME